MTILWHASTLHVYFVAINPGQKIAMYSHVRPW